ncbi:MAG: LysM peptidoglycan-binding domain-containing protein [Streptosporangiaceae bacterium]
MSAMPAEIMPEEPERMPALPEHRQANAAVRQASTAPGQASAAVRQASTAPRQASSASRQTSRRPRRTSPRPRPAGVRSCSAALRADPLVMAPQTPLVLPSPAEPAVAESPRPRLTARGRSVLAAGAVVVATLLWFGVASAQAAGHGASPSAGGHAAASQVVVQPGQTLWSIALQADPSADTRLVVQRIVAMNSLTGENIAAGQHLWVP